MVSYNGPGYSLSDLNNNVVNLVDVYGFLIVEWIVMLLLWWYLEQVIPSGIGIKKHPLFFLGFKKEKDIDISPETDNKKIPDDVKYENEKVLEVDAKEKYSILVQNIRKVYPSVDNNPPKVAVKGISFGVETNVCLGILGHNGAGKTTLIQMLTGFFEPTSGTAFINGKNIIGEIDEIHAIMGICPQHDILWDQLTGKEHLMFYGRIKGLKGKILKEEVKKTLQKVNLYDARNKVSRAYSGGMKRRLSVAISIIGFPKVIFLDEPSTGLDPKSRQDLWKVISETKKESTIILTTHSMEEADALCDKITIMSEGEMKCIGVSADLKKRFGSGFKLSIQVEKGYDTEPASQFIHKLFPHCVLINEISGTKNFQIPKKEVFLEHIFEEMEKNKKELHITDWAITNTTLEEVFLAISGEGPMISKEDENNNNNNNNIFQTNGNNINNHYFSDDSD
jgi:ABC-type multidrug transport system ATPase subunit